MSSADIELVESTIKSWSEEYDNQTESLIKIVHNALMKYISRKFIDQWPCLHSNYELDDETAVGIVKLAEKESNCDESISEIFHINDTSSSGDDIFVTVKIHAPSDIISIANETPINQQKTNPETKQQSLPTIETNSDEAKEEHIESKNDKGYIKDELVQNKRGLLICCLCNKRKVNKFKLIKHLFKHNGVRRSCFKCRKSFNNYIDYEIHKKFEMCQFDTGQFSGELFEIKANSPTIDTIDMKELILCPKCGLRFKKSYNVQQHLKNSICSYVGLQLLKCKHKCKVKINTQQQLDDHMESTHSHPCRICLKKFPTVRQLNRHFTTHKRIHKCEHCNEEFPIRKLLREHKKDKHVVLKEKVCYKCQYCDKTFNRKALWRKHTYKIHPEKDTPPIFACDKCPSILKTQNSFNEHRKLHTEANIFVCHTCNCGFKLKTFLKRHLLKHSSDKRFICDKCNAKFKRSDHLKRHIQILHEGKKIISKPKPKPKKTPKQAAPMKPPLSKPSGSQPFFSLIDVQSGELFTVPASDYNLLFKEQAKVETPIMNPEPSAPITWPENPIFPPGNTPIPLPPQQQEFPFIPVQPKEEIFPQFNMNQSRELCLPPMNNSVGIIQNNYAPPNIIPQNYTEVSSNDDIVVYMVVNQ